jgi:hypothetical protein
MFALSDYGRRDGTNVQGSLAKLNSLLFPRLTLTATGYFVHCIDRPEGQQNSTVHRLQFDALFAFSLSCKNAEMRGGCCAVRIQSSRGAHQEQHSYDERIGERLIDIFLHPPQEVQDPEERGEVGEAMELLPARMACQAKN